MIAAKKPEFFVAENVAGMLQGKKVEAFQYLIGQLQQCGYHVSYKLVDCADYGVPQNRQRVFIVGLRNDKYDSEFAFPEPTHIGNHNDLKNAIGDLCSPQELTQNKNNQWDAFSHEYIVGTWSPHFMSRQRVRSWNECSFTIPATGRHVPLHPSANKMVQISSEKFDFDPNSPCKYRRLSVRECARIQTFPDNFEFKYDAIDAGYLMVGNAVPVEMARVIGVALKERITQGH
jgi:DNA (cytosine-5)-methyltransferase 1